MLAPTGTIGLMMDCDTTGIEPDLALTKAKKLVGGGTMFIVNQTIPRALRQLGYDDGQVDAIVAYIDEHKTIIGAPAFKAEHLPVFACSMGDNTIHYMGHVKMMAAVQPFISGAISKTVNMPEDVSIEDVEDLYLESWRLGLKAVAIYRDNCKVGQPLSTQKKAGAATEGGRRARGRAHRRDDHRAGAGAAEAAAHPDREDVLVPRRRLPRLRDRRRVRGRPPRRAVPARSPSRARRSPGIMDAFAISVSHGLQYGVPLEAFVEMFTNMRFEPAGMTDDPDIRFATSLVDYIFRRLAVEYLPEGQARGARDPHGGGAVAADAARCRGGDDARAPVRTTCRPRTARRRRRDPRPQHAAAKCAEREVVLCHVCGDIMQRAGSCHACPTCGSTSGCS